LAAFAVKPVTPHAPISLPPNESRLPIRDADPLLNTLDGEQWIIMLTISIEIARRFILGKQGL
jgi:hypothetical protein